MLLQMTFEKLAKAAFARKGMALTHSHDGASRLLLLLARAPGGSTLPGNQSRVFAAVRELENAQPSIVKHSGLPQYPQLEYPWENPATNLVEWPARHLPVAKAVGDPHQRLGPDLLKLAHAMSAQFDALFP